MLMNYARGETLTQTRYKYTLVDYARTHTHTHDERRLTEDTPACTYTWKLKFRQKQHTPINPHDN